MYQAVRQKLVGSTDIEIDCFYRDSRSIHMLALRRRITERLMQGVPIKEVFTCLSPLLENLLLRTYDI